MIRAGKIVHANQLTAMYRHKAKVKAIASVEDAEALADSTIHDYDAANKLSIYSAELADIAADSLAKNSGKCEPVKASLRAAADLHAEDAKQAAAEALIAKAIMVGAKIAARKAKADADKQIQSAIKADEAVETDINNVNNIAESERKMKEQRNKIETQKLNSDRKAPENQITVNTKLTNTPAKPRIEPATPTGAWTKVTKRSAKHRTEPGTWGRQARALPPHHADFMRVRDDLINTFREGFYNALTEDCTRPVKEIPLSYDAAVDKLADYFARTHLKQNIGIITPTGFQMGQNIGGYFKDFVIDNENIYTDFIEFEAEPGSDIVNEFFAIKLACDQAQIQIENIDNNSKNNGKLIKKAKPQKTTNQQ